MKKNLKENIIKIATFLGHPASETIKDENKLANILAESTVEGTLFNYSIQLCIIVSQTSAQVPKSSRMCTLFGQEIRFSVAGAPSFGHFWELGVVRLGFHFACFPIEQ